MNDQATPVVYVTQEMSHNFTPAEAMGEVHFITDTEMSNIPASKANGRIRAEVHEFLRDYRPGFDYILQAGNPATAAYVFMMVGKAHPSEMHQLLRWDSMSKDYLVHQIQL